MPLYEYQCKPNRHRFEARHGMMDEPVQACPECGGEVRRVIQPVGIVFKGSGFYATDSRSTKSSVKPSEQAPSSNAESKSDASSESKSESKTESKSDSGGESSSDSNSKSKADGKSEPKSKPAAS